MPQTGIASIEAGPASAASKVAEATAVKPGVPRTVAPMGEILTPFGSPSGPTVCGAEIIRLP